MIVLIAVLDPEIIFTQNIGRKSWFKGSLLRSICKITMIFSKKTNAVIYFFIFLEVMLKKSWLNFNSHFFASWVGHLYKGAYLNRHLYKGDLPEKQRNEN